MKILYVDDEPDIREVASLSLELDGQMEVRTAESGADALGLLNRGEYLPDLFLLDVMMPEMDGPTLLGEIRKRPALADIPAIFMTARTQPHEKERFIAAGAVGVIAKPFDPMSLAGEVRAVLAAA